MEHILITCNNRPTRVIWQLAREIWPSQTYNWPEISLGLILECGTITSPRGDTHPNIPQVEQNRRTHHTKGATCLIQITLIESAHLIWVLQCERVIRGIQHSDGEIKARWIHTINTRLTDYKITATKIKREKEFQNLIKATWEPALQILGELPEDWLYSASKNRSSVLNFLIVLAIPHAPERVGTCN